MALSENLRTVAGWFNTTLPAPGMRAISFLRLDGDAYASTRDALVALYPRVSRGGIVYVDDYGGYGGCAAAVDEYRRAHGVTAPLQMIWEPIRKGFTVKDKETGGTTFKKIVLQKYEAVWWRVS